MTEHEDDDDRVVWDAIYESMGLSRPDEGAAECYGNGDWPAVDSLECDDPEC